MNKDKALQMCLEYIETDKHERKYVRHAIKAALEQPEQEPVTCRFCHSKKGCWAWQCYHCGEIDDVQQPPPLPKQEPVGKVVEVNNDGFRCEFSQHLAVGTKLYTAPAQPPVQEPVNPTAQEMHNAAANLALMKEMFGAHECHEGKAHDIVDGKCTKCGVHRKERNT